MQKELTVEDFEPMNLPEELKGLTAQILFDLYDISVKWGQPTEDRMCGNTIKIGESRILIQAHLSPPGVPGIYICKQAKPDSTVFMTVGGAFIFQTKGDVHVIWHRLVTVAEMETAIRNIDGFARSKRGNEFFGKEGERLALSGREVELVKMKVSQIFTSPDSVFMIPPDIPYTAETVLAQFDHPELLCLVKSGCLTLVCLKPVPAREENLN